MKNINQILKTVEKNQMKKNTSNKKPLNDKSNQFEFKSLEERWLSQYLQELKDNDIILNYSYECDTFDLFPGFKRQTQLANGKLKEVTVFRAHQYTPDFKITWNPTYKNQFFSVVDDLFANTSTPFVANKEGDSFVSYLECKPVTNYAVKHMEAKMREATLNVKWLYQLKGIFTNIVEIGVEKGLFLETFVPKMVLSECVYKITKFNGDGSIKFNKGESKFKSSVKTLVEYVAKFVK